MLPAFNQRCRLLTPSSLSPSSSGCARCQALACCSVLFSLLMHFGPWQPPPPPPPLWLQGPAHCTPTLFLSGLSSYHAPLACFPPTTLASLLCLWLWPCADLGLHPHQTTEAHRDILSSFNNRARLSNLKGDVTFKVMLFHGQYLFLVLKQMILPD